MENYMHALQNISNLGDGCRISGSWSDPEMKIARELWKDGYLEGVDACSDGGICFIDVRLTLKGRRLLERLSLERPNNLRNALRLLRKLWLWAFVIVVSIASIITFATTNLANIKAIIS